jgi:Transposase DDE domain
MAKRDRASRPDPLLRHPGFGFSDSRDKDALTIDRDAVERDQRLDGTFVLRTSTELPAAEVALAYKSLWRVERAFRETKQTLDVRPLYHHRDDTTVGHIVGCFLALRLEVDLQRRLDAAGVDCSWPDLMRDLADVNAVDVTLDDRRYRLRTDLRGHASAAFAAAGVRPPRVVEHIPDVPPVIERLAGA